MACRECQAFPLREKLVINVGSQRRERARRAAWGETTRNYGNNGELGLVGMKGERGIVGDQGRKGDKGDKGENAK